jgi:HD-GYP domain-containing protein (c-di-GMP phosphodiesterase class II)
MKRSYQEAMSHAEAMAQIAAGAGIHFDPTVVEAFNALDWDDRLNGGG